MTIKNPMLSDVWEDSCNASKYTASHVVRERWREKIKHVGICSADYYYFPEAVS